jgi:hypothetical protein
MITPASLYRRLLWRYREWRVPGAWVRNMVWKFREAGMPEWMAIDIVKMLVSLNYIGGVQVRAWMRPDDNATGFAIRLVGNDMPMVVMMVDNEASKEFWILEEAPQDLFGTD